MDHLEPTPQDRMLLQALASTRPPLIPQAALLWTALVDIGEREALGPSSHGERFIVPIHGGRFWGGPGHESITGFIRPGGADRQLLRADGVKELRAIYEMQADDGTVLSIDNEVLIDDSLKPQRYALSRIRVTAPLGPHAWLNRRLLVGTLQTLRPEREAVLIRAFVMAT